MRLNAEAPRTSRPVCRGFRTSKFLLSGLAALSLAATTLVRRAEAEPAPVDPEVRLVTIGTGLDIAAAGGHVGLEVVDRAAGTDLIYNWGLYDFDKPGFLKDYVSGILDYWAGVSSASKVLGEYQSDEPERAIWTDTIRLTPAQTAVLRARIAWWLKPENHVYRYDIWHRNCTTIIRDMLDEALGGRLRPSLAMPAGRTYRDLGRQSLAPFPVVALGADILTASPLDGKMTAWDELYLPLLLRQHLLALNAVGDDGKERPGMPLLYDPQTLHEGVAVPKPGFSAYTLAMVALTVVALILGGTTVRCPERAASLRLRGVALVALGVFCGFWGLLLVFMWAFTGHVATYWNANLFAFWPTDIVLAAWGLLQVVWPRALTSASARLGLRYYASLHLLGLVALLALSYFGGVRQDVSALAAFIYPPLAMAYFFLALRRPGLTATQG